MNTTDEVLFSEIAGTQGNLGVILLNRPQAFNALTLNMCAAIDEQLQVWQKAAHIKAVVVRSEHPKAFCAGGDIRYLYETGQVDPDKAAEFTAIEYRMNQRIHDFTKPYIAFMDGITMGGGVGVSVHGSHRVVSEFTLFAMPETGIGFFPDVGGSYFLPRCPGEIGMYLALTGARLKAADILYAEIATHYIPREKIAATIQLLANTAFSGDGKHSVSDILQQQAERVGESALEQQRALIDHCFTATDCTVILENLAQSTEDWCQDVLKTLQTKSPLSLAVTFEQMRRAAMWLDFDICMKMEYFMSRQFFKTADFYEGVRAVVIDKDQQPKWSPAQLKNVTVDMVNAFFIAPVH